MAQPSDITRTRSAAPPSKVRGWSTSTKFGAGLSASAALKAAATNESRMREVDMRIGVQKSGRFCSMVWVAPKDNTAHPRSVENLPAHLLRRSQLLLDQRSEAQPHSPEPRLRADTCGVPKIGNFSRPAAFFKPEVDRKASARRPSAVCYRAFVSGRILPARNFFASSRINPQRRYQA
jgi:hypothetical protein